MLFKNNRLAPLARAVVTHKDLITAGDLSGGTDYGYLVMNMNNPHDVHNTSSLNITDENQIGSQPDGWNHLSTLFQFYRCYKSRLTVEFLGFTSRQNYMIDHAGAASVPGSRDLASTWFWCCFLIHDINETSYTNGPTSYEAAKDDSRVYQLKRFRCDGRAVISVDWHEDYLKPGYRLDNHAAMGSNVGYIQRVGIWFGTIDDTNDFSLKIHKQMTQTVQLSGGHVQIAEMGVDDGQDL